MVDNCDNARHVVQPVSIASLRIGCNDVLEHFGHDVRCTVVRNVVLLNFSVGKTACFIAVLAGPSAFLVKIHFLGLEVVSHLVAEVFVAEALPNAIASNGDERIDILPLASLHVWFASYSSLVPLELGFFVLEVAKRPGNSEVALDSVVGDETTRSFDSFLFLFILRLVVVTHWVGAIASPQHRPSVTCIGAVKVRWGGEHDCSRAALGHRVFLQLGSKLRVHLLVGLNQSFLVLAFFEQ